jgi:hypothetical protein
MTRDTTNDTANDTTSGTAKGRAGGQVADTGQVAEMTETVTLLYNALDAIGRYVKQHHLSDVEIDEARVADDRDLVEAWHRAGGRARIEALTTIAALAAQTSGIPGASAGGMSAPDSSAGVLLAHAIREGQVPLPVSQIDPFGPLSGPTAAYAAELVHGDTERDSRVVFAVLGLHILTAHTTPHDNPRGTDPRVGGGHAR